MILWRALSPITMKPERHSLLIDPIHRSAYAFKFGLRGGSRTVFTPADSRMFRNLRQYFESLS